MTKILAFTDTHLHEEYELDKVINILKREKDSIDYFIFTGDIVGIRYRSKQGNINKEIEKEAKIFIKFLKVIESLKIPFYFVLGNRDSILLVDTIAYALLYYDLIKETLESSDSLYCLNYGPNENFKIKITEKLFITANEKLVDRGTILIHHNPPVKRFGDKFVEDFKKIKEIKNRTFLYLVGHTHYGQIWDNYFNLGFVLRDDLHGARPMWGFYWIFNIKANKIDFEIKFIEENNIRRFKCPRHNFLGEWIIHWKKCPVCYWERDIGEKIKKILP